MKTSIKRLLILLTLMLLFALPAAAQEGYPLPDSLPIITPENAADLQQLASIGAALPGQLVWSPDNVTLAVSTSEETLLYNTADLDAAPVSIPASKNISFNDAGELVADSQRWDATTGDLLGEVAPVTPSITSPSGNIVATWDTQAGETLITLTRSDRTVTHLNLGGEYEYRVAKIAFSPDEKFAALALNYDVDIDEYGRYSTLLAGQLWNIDRGTFIAELPHDEEFQVLDALTFLANGDLLVMTVYIIDSYTGDYGEVQIWDGRTGEIVGGTNHYYPPAHFSSDGKLIAFLTFKGLRLWTDREIGTLIIPSRYWLERQTKFHFSPDNLTLAATANQRVALWNLGEEFDLKIDHFWETEAHPFSLIYTPDSKFLVALEAESNIEIWDTASGTRQTHIAAEIGLNTGYGYAISPDSRWLKVRSYTRNSPSSDVYIWELNTEREHLKMPFSPSLTFNAN